MPKGIIVFGAPGAGDTTLGKELARRLGVPHFDLDDYHWRWDTEIPYAIFRSREERTVHLMHDISICTRFVMSGSMWSIRKAFEPMFEMAVFLTVPAEIRAERLRSREFARWGCRVLPGGDMFEANEAHRNYTALARRYETDEPLQCCLKQHEQWAAELPCPVLRADGTKAIAENAEWIVKEYRAMQAAEYLK